MNINFIVLYPKKQSESYESGLFTNAECAEPLDGCRCGRRNESIFENQNTFGLYTSKASLP